MLARLALRNVRRSVRDYAVYFVTLVFGVAVFYAFNSVQGQSILFDLGTVGSETAFELTGRFLGMFSVLIACVLGFLVVYANRFLVRRRKAEFGTYLLLGMRPWQTSAIVLMETACVGCASLAVGLIAGIALSQGLSFLTAGLFGIAMAQYRFVFSPDALVQTLACFACIFAVVALFNTLSIRRFRLIDLLSAHARNERSPLRNPWVGLAGFVAACALLAWAYVTLVENGLMEFNFEFWKATALMLVGTLLFFWSASGFAVCVLARARGVYYRGLAMFTVRQVASKANTAFLSLFAVCVMLFFSLTVFSVGAGFVQVFTGNVEESTQFDATCTANVYLGTDFVDEDYLAEMRETDPAEAEDYLRRKEETARQVRDAAGQWDWSVLGFLESEVPGWDGFVERAVQVDLYQFAEGSDTYGDLLERFGATTGSQVQDDALRPQAVSVVGVSQFNTVRELAGQPPVDVPEGRYAVDNAADAAEGLSRAMAQEGTQIAVGGQTLDATGECVRQALSTSTLVSDGAVLVVPDSTVESLRAQGAVPYASYVDIDYKVDRAEGDRLLREGLAAALPPEAGQASAGWGFATSPWPVSTLVTAGEVVEQSGGMRMMITYLALYIGFVFLIATAAILAIQQLSETSDSLPRYRVLAELGCDRRMVFRSLGVQVAVYFLAPLALAAAHAVCAVGVIGQSVFLQLGVSVTGPILLTVAFTAVIYGSYLVVTLFASRGIVRAALGRRLLG